MSTNVPKYAKLLVSALYFSDAELVLTKLTVFSASPHIPAYVLLKNVVL